VKDLSRPISYRFLSEPSKSGSYVPDTYFFSDRARAYFHNPFSVKRLHHLICYKLALFCIFPFYFCLASDWLCFALFFPCLQSLKFLFAIRITQYSVRNKLALFFQIVCRLGLPFSAHSGLLAFELFTFTLPQIGFVFSNSFLLDTDLHRLTLFLCLLDTDEHRFGFTTKARRATKRK
jgi:hypothetical protein